MNPIAKSILATSLFCTGISVTQASSEEAIDPSNLTQVSTSAYLGLSNKGDVKMSASLGLSLNNGQMAMGTLEGSMDNEGNYNDSRLQYFHVFSTENMSVPRVAASLDIIDNANFTTAAIGGVAMFNPNIESLTIFGRVGLLAGSYDDSFASMMGESNTDVLGGMAAAYFSWKPGKDGTYLMLSPEYTYMDGDIETSILKTSVTLGTPLSNDSKRWGQFKIENSSGTMKASRQTIDISDTTAWVFYKVFF